MEWVTTTAKTLPEAIDLALDNLGVDEAEAEIVVLEEPKQGLFGRTRGVARVEARVKPKAIRPKVERGRPRRSRSNEGGRGGRRNNRNDGRRRNKGGRSDSESKGSGSKGSTSKGSASKDGSNRGGDQRNVATAERSGNGKGDQAQGEQNKNNQQGSGRSRSRRRGKGGSSNGGQDKAAAAGVTEASAAGAASNGEASSGRNSGRRTNKSNSGRSNKSNGRQKDREQEMKEESPVEEVAEHLRTFLGGLTEAFGLEGGVDIDNTEADVLVASVQGQHGLMVGPKGRTLDAIQELARVSSQRTAPSSIRIRVDVGGYRQQRAAALGEFARKAADKAVDNAAEVALDPMSPADRKSVHDALVEDSRVETRSVGTEPRRKVIVIPLKGADGAGEEE